MPARNWNNAAVHNPSAINPKPSAEAPAIAVAASHTERASSRSVRLARIGYRRHVAGVVGAADPAAGGVRKAPRVPQLRLQREEHGEGRHPEDFGCAEDGDQASRVNRRWRRWLAPSRARCQPPVRGSRPSREWRRGRSRGRGAEPDAHRWGSRRRYSDAPPCTLPHRGPR